MVPTFPSPSLSSQHRCSCYTGLSTRYSSAQPGTFYLEAGGRGWALVLPWTVDEVIVDQLRHGGWPGLTQGFGLSVQKQLPSSLAWAWRRISRSCTTDLRGAPDASSLIHLPCHSRQAPGPELMVVSNGLTPKRTIFNNPHFPHHKVKG